MSSSSSLSSPSPPPTRAKLTPPASPLQRVKSPFTRRRSLLGLTPTRRSRTIARVSILLITLLIAVSVLNEWLCAANGCYSRTGVDAGRGGGGWGKGRGTGSKKAGIFVGGGAVLRAGAGRVLGHDIHIHRAWAKDNETIKRGEMAQQQDGKTALRVDDAASRSANHVRVGHEHSAHMGVAAYGDGQDGGGVGMAQGGKGPGQTHVQNKENGARQVVRDGGRNTEERGRSVGGERMLGTMEMVWRA